MNTESKHTKGRLKQYGDCLRTEGSSCDSGLVCRCAGENDAERTANAAEIARRWNCHDELVAALERAERQLSIAFNPSESPIVELCRSEAQLSCNQARAALAKAKG
jgi:hypothetical protein